jgi:hypothetical protein
VAVQLAGGELSLGGIMVAPESVVRLDGGVQVRERRAGTARAPMSARSTSVATRVRSHLYLLSRSELIREVVTVIAHEDPRELIEQAFSVIRAELREEHVDQRAGLVRLSTVGGRAVE